MAYDVTFPETWISKDGSTNLIEYQFVKPGVAMIELIAHDQFEDHSQIVDQQVQREKNGCKQEGIDCTVVVEQVTRAEINGRSCVNLVIRVDDADGELQIRKRMLFHSAVDGTFLLNLFEVGNLMPEDRLEIEAILASIRLPAPPADVSEETLRSFRTLKGKEIPYTMKVPYLRKEDKTPFEDVEFALARRGVGTFRVAASSTPDNYSDFKAGLLPHLREEIPECEAVTLKSDETVVIDSRSFNRFEVVLEMKSGTRTTMIYFDHSSDNGSLLLSGTVYGNPPSAVALEEIEQILRSVRIDYSKAIR